MARIAWLFDLRLPLKSPSIPLYERGKVLVRFSRVPPFDKGGLGGIWGFMNRPPALPGVT
jgi:hypothetical protein